MEGEGTRHPYPFKKCPRKERAWRISRNNPRKQPREGQRGHKGRIEERHAAGHTEPFSDWPRKGGRGHPTSVIRFARSHRTHNPAFLAWLKGRAVSGVVAKIMVGVPWIRKGRERGTSASEANTAGEGQEICQKGVSSPDALFAREDPYLIYP